MKRDNFLSKSRALEQEIRFSDLKKSELLFFKLLIDFPNRKRVKLHQICCLIRILCFIQIF